MTAAVVIVSLKSCSGCVLDGVDLGGLEVLGAFFTSASLMDANLTGASLDGCSFIASTLSNTNLSGASLVGATITGAGPRLLPGVASAQGVNLSGADLSDASVSYYRDAMNDSVLEGTNLAGADFFDVTLTGSVGIPLNADQASWRGVTCPDGTYVEDQPPGGTCVGHFLPLP